MVNQKVKEQFNKQAEKFANWSVGKNVEYLNGYFDFCNIQPNDILLDVACGPGDFTNLTARRILKASGVDISDKEIEIANRQSSELGLTNVVFDCSDVENLPYSNNSFTVVVCKSAFHHFMNPEIVFKEMIRCCENGGKISIQDIRAYDDSYVNEFFEAFDKLIDNSHNKTLNEYEFNKLYSGNGIKKTGEFKLDVDLNVREYVDHAVQDKGNQEKIDRLLKHGLDDNRINNYLFMKDGELYFKRPVYLIIGIK